MASPPEAPGKKKTKTLVIIMLVVVVGIVVMSTQMARTSTTDYCMSCHEMKSRLDELKKSSHAVDKNKQPIQCAQCHIPLSVGPRYLVVKTVVGLNDLFVHYFGDPENLDRRALQVSARRFVMDENCLACHSDLYKDAKGEKPISAIGRLCHDAYLGKNGNTSRGCAGCHFNLAHLPDFDRRYFFNAEFVKRYPGKKGGGS